MDRYLNKYRNSSARLQTWNYGSHGAYFITICTHNREHFFGEILDGLMQPSAIGEIVESEWIKTPAIRPDMNLELDEFVVMPNHFHAIIIIGENEYNMERNIRRDAMHRVPTDEKHRVPVNEYGPQRKNLASIIRGFKSSVTVQAKKMGMGTIWQPLFYDHIIRNEQSFERIRQYIINNPLNWNEGGV
jgi:REP element-mobilizing transposase RayT